MLFARPHDDEARAFGSAHTKQHTLFAGFPQRSVEFAGAGHRLAVDFLDHIAALQSGWTSVITTPRVTLNGAVATPLEKQLAETIMRSGLLSFGAQNDLTVDSEMKKQAARK